MQNRRVQNINEKTLSYIVHVPGKKNVGPDTASRYPTGDPLRGLPGETPETYLKPPTSSHLRELLLAGSAQEDTDDEEHDRMELGMSCSAVNTLAHIEIITKMCG